ncbi:hypothetical protein HYDPIDRAFT_109382 [Hydnomerulius pinastri MD-312]|nr:hypothetical protein HYDPIDRAFT_109382 [Hydnomerulius pinastri MD-312]
MSTLSVLCRRCNFEFISPVSVQKSGDVVADTPASSPRPQLHSAEHSVPLANHSSQPANSPPHPSHSQGP